MIEVNNGSFINFNFQGDLNNPTGQFRQSGINLSNYQQSINIGEALEAYSTPGLQDVNNCKIFKVIRDDSSEVFLFCNNIENLSSITDFGRELKKLNELINRIKASPINKNINFIRNRNSYIRIKSYPNIETFDDFLKKSCFRVGPMYIFNTFLLESSNYRLQELDLLKSKQGELTNEEFDKLLSLFGIPQQTAPIQFQQPPQSQALYGQQGFSQQQTYYNPPPQKRQYSDKHYEIDQNGTLTFFKGYGNIIEKKAFANNQNIKRVICSDDIEIIGEDAFAECKNLVQIEAPSVTTIGQGAFKRSGLSEIRRTDLPNVDDIESYAFHRCNKLTRVCFPNLKTISKRVFSKSGLLKIEETDLPNVEDIEKEAFSNCEHLIEASFPKLETIGESAFSNCTNLICIDIPKINTIEEAFEYCDSLSKIYTNSINQCKLLYDDLIEVIEWQDDETMDERLGNGSIEFFCNRIKVDLKILKTT